MDSRGRICLLYQFPDFDDAQLILKKLHNYYLYTSQKNNIKQELSYQSQSETNRNFQKTIDKSFQNLFAVLKIDEAGLEPEKKLQNF